MGRFEPRFDAASRHRNRFAGRYPVVATRGQPDENYDVLTIAKYGTSAFLLTDRNPNIKTPSGLDLSYQDFAGTVADTSTQTVALGLDLSQGAALGSELKGNATTEVIGGGSASYDSGTEVYSIARGASASDTGSIVVSGLTSGLTYRVDLEGLTGDLIQIRIGGRFNTTLATLTAAEGRKVIFLTNVSGTTLWLNHGSNNFSSTFKIHSVKSVAGNHFFQSTSADEPTLTFANGQWGYVGDGASRGFDGGLVPASSSTLIPAFKAAAVSDIISGCQVGTNKFEIGTDANGKMIANVGSTVVTVTAASIVNVPGVGVLSASGSTYFAGWYPIAGGSETATGSFAGSIPTTQGVYSLQTNDDGSGAAFANATMWRNLFQQSAYSQAEAEAIAAGQWRRELASVA